MTQELDPIAEIRRIRDAQAAEFNYDPKAIGRHIQELQRTSGLTYLSKRPDGTECWMRYGEEVDGPTDEQKQPVIVPAAVRAKMAAQRAARESAA